MTMIRESGDAGISDETEDDYVMASDEQIDAAVDALLGCGWVNPDLPRSVASIAVRDILESALNLPTDKSEGRSGETGNDQERLRKGGRVSSQTRSAT